MEIDTSDYFSYKKNKMNRLEGKKNQNSSKLGTAFKLFFTTFIVIFIIMVACIMIFSSKIDIEVAKADSILENEKIEQAQDSTESILEEEPPKKIDTRLNLIQLADKTPNQVNVYDNTEESKSLLSHNNDANNISSKFERFKIQNFEQTKTTKQTPSSATANKSASQSTKQEIYAQTSQTSRQTEENSDVKLLSKKTYSTAQNSLEQNTTIMSKVFVGRYASFEEARAKQDEVKEFNPQLVPYVKKVGSIYSIQVGSYQEFSTAKAQAQILKSKGYDVWIYQQ